MLWSCKKLVSNLLAGNIFTKNVGLPYRLVIMKSKLLSQVEFYHLQNYCITIQHGTKALALHKPHRSNKIHLFSPPFSLLNTLLTNDLTFTFETFDVNLVMLIYLTIHSHFSIVCKSSLVLQNIQILTQSFEECVSVHELNLSDSLQSRLLH